MILLFLSIANAQLIMDIELSDQQFPQFFKLNQSYRIANTSQNFNYYLNITLQKPDNSFYLIATLGERYNNSSKNKYIDWAGQLENRKTRFLKLQPNGKKIYIISTSKESNNSVYSMTIRTTDGNESLCPNDCSNHGLCENSKCICTAPYIGNDCNQWAFKIQFDQTQVRQYQGYIFSYLNGSTRSQKNVKLFFETKQYNQIKIYVPNTEILYSKDNVYDLTFDNPLQLSIDVDWEIQQVLVIAAKTDNNSQITYLSIRVSSENTNNMPNYILAIIIIFSCIGFFIIIYGCWWLRKKKGHPNVYPVDPREINIIVEECSICLFVIQNHLLTKTQCGHSFHQDCLQEWFQRSSICPCCRANIGPEVNQPGPFMGQL